MNERKPIAFIVEGVNKVNTDLFAFKLQYFVSKILKNIDTFENNAITDCKISKKNVINFLNSDSARSSDAIVITNCVFFHVTQGSDTKEKREAINRIMSVIKKQYIPILVVVSSSKRFAEKLSESKLPNFVAITEKMMDEYRRVNHLRILINTTNLSIDEAMAKIVRKINSATRGKKNVNQRNIQKIVN